MPGALGALAMRYVLGKAEKETPVCAVHYSCACCSLLLSLLFIRGAEMKTGRAAGAVH